MVPPSSRWSLIEDRLGDGSLVEGGLALVGDHGQGRGQVGVAEDLPDGRRFASGQVNPAALGLVFR